MLLGNPAQFTTPGLLQSAARAKEATKGASAWTFGKDVPWKTKKDT
jgi:hypothetical protein